MYVIRQGKATGRILAGLLEEIKTEEEAIEICVKMRKKYEKVGIRLGMLYIQKEEGDYEGLTTVEFV